MEDFELESKSYFFPNRLTLFEQVSQSLSRLISEKKWRPGEMLPNETELAQMFNISPGTMRRALKLLVDKGVLIRHQGKGTFVAEFSNNQQLVYKRYIKLQPDNPEVDEAVPTKSDLLFFERVSPSLEIQQLLNLQPSDQVVHAGRTLSASSGIVTFDELWGVGKDFEKLTKENLAHHREKLLYAFYQSELGISITRSEERIKAVLLPLDLCNVFKLSYPQPVIEIRRVAFTFEDRPVEFHRQLSFTSRYHYRIF